MSTEESNREAALIAEAEASPLIKRLGIFTKLSGPGWLQGAITLGGGSLAGALYLGVIAGFGLLWLQPLAMICGIIMLSAIAYVTLSTEKAPFGLVNTHLSPALGWAWMIATIMANIVWCMPQFNLGRAAIQQNLLPFVGDSNTSTAIICLILLTIGFAINVLYESEGKGARTFDRIIKVMVGMIVISFILVVITLATTGGIQWGSLFGGLIPNPKLLISPAAGYADLIAASSHPDWWTAKIITDQRDIIIAAFGTAVGINMTWLLPYSLLKKSWGKTHRSFSIFDLSIGLFIPFFLATSCVVIAAASQFHTKIGDVDPNSPVAAGTLAQLQEAHPGTTNAADLELALSLVKRDNFQLATTLEPLAGKVVSQTIFGLGVLGMAVSTIIILMLINGLAFQELLGKRGDKNAHYIGCAVSGIAGFAGPFVWTGAAAAALAIPTSVIGGSLIPIAYFTFFLMMNSKKVLGENRPEGTTRIIWNVLMGFATGVATIGSVWVLYGKSHMRDWHGMIPAAGLVLLAILFIIGIYSFLKNERES
ncbi:divalent metal cation transporter [Candidatus Pelagisphaera phototrophica]|uniref:divalent metal cation transporter n=1 Tax=Candidatus Pelagisphaera phototrophica TaxID=2684113 RepID=UPI0019F31B88|nr:divalent metal cation transporter [Candidatus Pelagisphaera phototrophica]QXD32823.1 divalent metal cation transporter [Candidatus Pelagisphaera phototrophica]